ncbi:hypothetical protein T440DRAFT_554016 [Plenodomus tracheiphilus IPT5]|uniref:Uncharacterized protein n=1 Tax=Plenodomus tracheiphilus IPT5 TaxID=1408161 RepID=A0A6A7BA55_9PLEO|nr:hypothetical protein T440DRAFT_554016 [Plenodomus tracheiphilus IPT5]
MAKPLSPALNGSSRKYNDIMNRDIRALILEYMEPPHPMKLDSKWCGLALTCKDLYAEMLCDTEHRFQQWLVGHKALVSAKTGLDLSFIDNAQCIHTHRSLALTLPIQHLRKEVLKAIAELKHVFLERISFIIIGDIGEFIDTTSWEEDGYLNYVLNVMSREISDPIYCSVRS